MNDQISHDELAINEPIIDESQGISLRRFERQKRSAIPDDYLVYLQECESDLGIIDDDPVSFSQAMECINSSKWEDAMKDELKSMEHNKV